MDLILKARELFLAIRNKDWPNIIRLSFEIGKIIIDTLASQPQPSQPPPVPAMQTTKAAALKAMDFDALAGELEAVCNTQAPPGAAAAPAQGPLIDALKPIIGQILLKLLEKYIGGGFGA